MVELIKARTRTDAWIQAVRLLDNDRENQNVILEIAEPWHDTPAEQAFVKHFNEYLAACAGQGASVNIQSVEVTADWIFPWAYERKYGLDFADEYLADIELFRRTGIWGTYAERLVAIPQGRADGQPQYLERDGKRLNPLVEMIGWMNKRRKRGEHNSSCYELGLYQFEVDGYKPLQKPCLSHISVKVIDDAVHLTALYRNHDYRYKALGNLLGLARLLDFICRQTNLAPGTLIVHSTRGYFEAGVGGKTSLLEVIHEHEPNNGD